MQAFKLSALILIPFLCSSFASALYSKTPPKSGRIGYARYVVRDSKMSPDFLKKGTELFALHPGKIEFLTPIDSMQELDLLAAESHAANGICGSIDFYPLHYNLATEVSHTPPYFAPTAHFRELETLLGEVQLSKISDTVTTLSSLPSRYHRHSTGQNASQTVQTVFQNQLLIAADWKVAEFAHTNSPQRSVIARLEGETSDTIIFGAHLDSIGSRSNVEALSPGADDDASGIAILAEIMRIIEAKHLRFHRSIEFQGYAAEEIGLVGSREIAANYRANNKVVDAMLQFDMAFYSQSPTDGGLLFFLEDFTTLDLTRSGISWVKKYLGDVYRRGAMPTGAASDHKSWWEQGYPTLFPFENPEADNPYIHTINDTMDKFDDGTRMERMVKFGLLFLAYNAGLTSLDAPYAAEKNRLAVETIASDLHLAITGSGASYAFAVSAPKATTYLEFCQTESASDQRCSTKRLKLTIAEILKGRKVFRSDGNQAFHEAEKWRVEAYNASDELLARRQIEWQKP
ncbi:MAG: M20/M25/M40 family metallo-hydrolase [Oligoflexus sp.]|nr:M20/M25/M40 family metallo-hydrolase [Oligoflexus sp.]